MGESWEVVLFDGVDGVAVLDGRMAGGRSGRRLVAVSPSGEAWESALRLYPQRPAAAILLLAGWVEPRCRASRERVRRMLSTLAVEALDEQGGRDR